MPDPRVQQAIALARQGQRREARELIIAFLEQNPRHAPAWVILAQVVDDREAAIYCLEQVLILKPGDPWATHHLNRLRRRANKQPMESGGDQAASTAIGETDDAGQRDPIILFGSIGILAMVILLVVLSLVLR